MAENVIRITCTPYDVTMPDPAVDLEAHLRWRSERSGQPLEEVRRRHFAVAERRAREVAELEAMYAEG